jgi:ACS family hexuronate transporter-like MFS transporter
MVPSARTRAGNRNIHRRLQRRRNRYAVDRAFHHAALGVAQRVHRYRLVQRRLACCLVDGIPPAAGPSPGVSRGARADPGEQRLLRIPETWAYAVARFLIDPIWWMFLFWLPDFFAKRYGLDLEHFGPPLVVVYVVSDLGSVAGGWLSSRMLARGVSLNKARKLTLLLASLIVMPVMFAMYADNLWLAVAIVGLATAGHQAFSVNLYTFPSDVFPKAAVASVVGIGGTAGAVGGMLMSKYAGWVLDTVGSYTPIFIVAGTVYLLALLVFHRLAPRLAPVAGQTDD